MATLGGLIHNFAITETAKYKNKYTVYKITSIVSFFSEFRRQEKLIFYLFIFRSSLIRIFHQYFLAFIQKLIHGKDLTMSRNFTLIYARKFEITT